MFNKIYLNDVHGGSGMDKNAHIKNHIIEVTTKLIEKHNGSIKDITARMIAAKAGVGLGLINYHFGSKEIDNRMCAAYYRKSSYRISDDRAI